MGRIDKRENGNMEKEKLDAHQHQILNMVKFLADYLLYAIMK